MTPLTSHRLAAEAVRRLDDYATDVLACPPTLARHGGIHLVSEPQRGLPVWHGYTLPVIALAFSQGAVVACRPDLLTRLQQELGSDAHLPNLDGPAFRRLVRAVRKTVANAFTLGGDLRALDAATFSPSPTMDRAEHIPLDDAAALHLRTRFDGAVFGVRGPHGRLVSWAALKLKSAHIWELAVATEGDYRGRGFARDVVSAASRYTLEEGRLPIYIHDRDNNTSAFVARAVGYQLYAEIALAEY